MPLKCWLPQTVLAGRLGPWLGPRAVLCDATCPNSSRSLGVQAQSVLAMAAWLILDDGSCGGRHHHRFSFLCGHSQIAPYQLPLNDPVLAHRRLYLFAAARQRDSDEPMDKWFVGETPHYPRGT